MLIPAFAAIALVVSSDRYVSAGSPALINLMRSAV
jgi:hypothetical protein